jgi:hypothetical protein
LTPVSTQFSSTAKYKTKRFLGIYLASALNSNCIFYWWSLKTCMLAGTTQVIIPEKHAMVVNSSRIMGPR